MVAMHVAAGSCTRWSIVLHFYALWFSGEPRGLWLVCSECWVVVQEQPANAPAVQQCISLINSAALTVHGTSPAQKPLGSNGPRQRGDSRRARKGQNFEREAVDEQGAESKGFRSVSDTGDAAHHFSSYMIMCCSRRRFFFFSSLSLSVCRSLPPHKLVLGAGKHQNTHQTATADLVFHFHTLPTHAAFACALGFFIQHLFSDDGCVDSRDAHS